MKNALTFLTRRCPRACSYCALRDAHGLDTELTTQEWVSAFERLKRMGVGFNLVLGNETWLLGNELRTIFTNNTIPYALYTSCPPSLFDKYRGTLLKTIDNVSCGLDYPKLSTPIKDDSYWKSMDAWRGLEWVKKHYPLTDCQGTITVHRQNYKYVPQIVHELTSLGVFSGINFIHWDKDGGFDFFPERNALKDLLFFESDFPKLRQVLDNVLEDPGLLQNPEMLKEDLTLLTQMKWHCEGDPYGGPTVDSDGSLRVCGYRKGTRTSKLSIFDLPEKAAEWEEAVQCDAWDCPGCGWSYPWMYHHWLKDPEMGDHVFIHHAGVHIPKEKWSERRIDGTR